MRSCNKETRERDRNKWLIKIAHTVSELGETFGNWLEISLKKLVEAAKRLVIYS
jgi:hypothetical protein